MLRRYRSSVEQRDYYPRGAFYFALNTMPCSGQDSSCSPAFRRSTKDFKANLFTCVLTGAGMGLVVFICLLFVNVLAQTIGFLNTVYIELTFRL